MLRLVLLFYYIHSIFFQLSPYLEESEIKEIIPIIIDSAYRYKVDPEIISIMIGIESSGNPKAVSYVGAKGPLQVRWCIWKNMLHNELGLNENDLLSFKHGIPAGARILRQYLVKSGSYREALKKYNGVYSYADKILSKKIVDILFDGDYGVFITPTCNM